MLRRKVSTLGHNLETACVLSGEPVDRRLDESAADAAPLGRRVDADELNSSDVVTHSLAGDIANRLAVQLGDQHVLRRICCGLLEPDLEKLSALRRRKSIVHPEPRVTVQRTR